jgi:hypothetical protein
MFIKLNRKINSISNFQAPTTNDSKHSSYVTSRWEQNNKNDTMVDLIHIGLLCKVVMNSNIFYIYKDDKLFIIITIRLNFSLY